MEKSNPSEGWLASGDERHRVSGCGEPSPEVTPNTAATKNTDPHADKSATD